jgi:hypothetical protein
MTPNRPTVAMASAAAANTARRNAFILGCASSPSRNVPNDAMLTMATPGVVSPMTRRIVDMGAEERLSVRIASEVGANGKNDWLSGK